jgi:hypothetical protein
MLGVRRATVTDTLHIIEGHHAIKSSRGRIVIRDREKLERLAGDSYGFAEMHYRRSIAPFGKQCGGLEAALNKRESSTPVGADVRIANDDGLKSRLADRKAVRLLRPKPDARLGLQRALLP